MQRPANIWFTELTPGRAWWSRMACTPALLRLRSWRFCADMSARCVPIDDIPGSSSRHEDSTPSGGSQAALRANTRAVQPLSAGGIGEGALTGMRTAFNPAPLMRSTSDWLNHVSLDRLECDICVQWRGVRRTSDSGRRGRRHGPVPSQARCPGQTKDGVVAGAAGVQL